MSEWGVGHLEEVEGKIECVIDATYGILVPPPARLLTNIPAMPPEHDPTGQERYMFVGWCGYFGAHVSV
jgi:hypothetical protein